MKKIYIALALATAIAGCQTAPAATPMEAHLNRYAGAEAVAMNCPSFGGYGSVASMKADADKNLSKARKLGATDADIKAARTRLNGQLQSTIFLVGPMEACSAFMNRLAWAGDSTPVIQPAKKK